MTGPPLRVLVADDNAANRTVALLFLERLGHRAEAVTSGREVIDRLAHARHDVVLMDVQMPGMDGLAATRAIRQRWPGDAGPRIIALTAEAGAGDRERCLAAGMDDYVAKPIELEELQHALSRCAARAGSPDAAAPGRTPAAAAYGLDRGPLDQLERDLGSLEAVGRVVRAFLDQAPAAVTALRDAAARGDADSVRAAAHALKGSSAMLGATGLAGQCVELERVARAGSAADVAARVAAIEALYAETARALRQYAATQARDTTA